MAKRVLCIVPFRLVSQVNVDNFMSDVFGLEDEAGPVRIGAEPHAVDADQPLRDWPWGLASFPQGPGRILRHGLQLFAQLPELTVAALWLATAAAGSRSSCALERTSCPKFNF